MLTRQETENEYLDGAVVLSMPRDLVITTGDDAPSFLNGQLSQQIESMTIGESRRSLLLDPKGKVTAWLRVSRVEDNRFWLDADVGTGEAMLERLKRFTLRTKVEFELLQAECFAIRGTELPPRPNTSAGQMAVDVGWTGDDGDDGYDIIGPAVACPDGPVGGPDFLDALRIRAGVPAMGKEFQRATIPAETGVVDISADFTKGCYTGQELVARVNSRGNNTPRKVHKWTASSPEAASIEEGAILTVDGTEVGIVTSVAVFGDQYIGLASIKRGSDYSQPVLIAAGGAPVSASLHDHQVLSV